MNKRIFATMLAYAVLVLAISALGQPAARTDAIWARSTAGAAITLDGQLNEAAWAQAESIHVYYGQDSGLPGSGYRNEGGAEPEDPTNATLKFLTVGNKLYLGAFIRDKSVGGGLFNKFDGLLMNLRSHARPARPAPPFECFYGWVTETWADPNTGNVGASPGFFGQASGSTDSARAIWNAVTTVLGTSNDDATPDVGWVTEVEFNLDVKSFNNNRSGGYDVTRPQGDILEFNISIYDADWQWPLDAARFSGNRAWFQGPWGNANSFNILRIYARPDVTVSSGAVPVIGPEVTIKNLATSAAPVIDGNLNDQIWSGASKFDIRYGDDALRASYPAVGPYRSGQFQPSIGGVTAAVVDPADATVWYFYKGNTFYLGIDVRDQVVTAIDNFDQFDGVNITINDRGATDEAEHRLITRELIARVGTGGTLARGGYLPFLVDSLSGAQAGLALKSGSTVDNPNDVDAGFTIELAFDLTKLGYPANLGDRVLWWGVTLLDGDSFVNTADNYGNRVWWFRENGGSAAPAWSHLDATPVSVVERGGEVLPSQFRVLGNYPNPFNPSTNIRFTLPEAGTITLKVFDLLGRDVETVALGSREAGAHETSFNAAQLPSGVYLYRLELTTTAAKKLMSTQYGKMVLMK